MDYEILPDEIERSIIKLDKADLRKEHKSGWGATTGGQALTRRYHERLTEGFRIALLDAHKGSRNEAQLVPLLRDLPVGVLALSSLQSILHSIGLRENFRDTLIKLGSSIANECWAAELTERNGTLAGRIARAVRSGRTTKARYKQAKAEVEKAQNYKRNPKHTKEQQKRRIETAKSLMNFKDHIWDRDALVTAGAWLWNVVSTSLPEVFQRVQMEGTSWSITLAADAWSVVDEALNRTVNSNPVFWPTAEKPKPWTDYAGGGSNDPRINGVVTVLRSFHKDTQSAVKHAIKDGTMQPALDALNALQAVPFKINTQVLEVIRECVGYQIEVKGLVPQNLVIPERPNSFEWASMDEAQQRLWKTKRGEKIKANYGFMGDRVLFQMDMQVADAMAQHDAFYTPMNLDWRGRVYGIPHFNYQREDRVRSLFLFAEGAPIGEEGLRWLKIHTANTGDFGKISKQPLEERVKWCDDNIQLIGNIASAPFVHTEWMHADKPFLHLAACFELSAALQQGPSYVTHLPTAYDGTCSGLQHLSGMTRADEGRMVNLTSSEKPQDVYQTIADDTYEQITRDLHDLPDPDAKDPVAAAKTSKDIRELARLFLDFDGNRRNMAKRNVMTYAYSSKKFGMASQQQVDLMEPLSREVLEGKRAEHPFVGYQHGPFDSKGNQQPSKAARYFAGRVFDAIENRIHKPAEAMKFLQAIAKALAHEGKPVRWTTPVGIPWINRYHERVMTTVNLYLVDGGIKERVRMNVATGSEKAIDKDKAANGVAPNFVHALDASHLLLVANAAASEGIRSIATVHDSFGCLAPQAARFNKVIREQFAAMYETHDVLTQIHERASCDLTDANRNKLPDLLTYGNLNLKDILDADFAFA